MASANTYSFQVQIPITADFKFLKNGNYQLGVQKISSTSVPGSVPVQWLSVALLSQTITVSWDEEYSVFFTTQDLTQDGVHIKQESRLDPALLGQKYSYAGYFDDVGSAIRPDGIEIVNNLRDAPDFYGVAQKVQKNGTTIQAPLIASTILYNGEVGFRFSEQVKVYFINQAEYTGKDGITAKYLDVSSSTILDLTNGGTSAVAYDYSTGTWSPTPPVSEGALGVPLSLAPARPAPTEITTLEDLFAYDPALNSALEPIIISVVLKFALPILKTIVLKWLRDHFRATNLDIGVAGGTGPGGVSTTQTLTLSNNGNLTPAQIRAAAEALKGLSIPIQSGRFLAAPGVYEEVTTQDKILNVEIKKTDATFAALRLILPQMAAAQKASSKGFPGSNGTYGGYLNGPAMPVYN